LRGEIRQRGARRAEGKRRRERGTHHRRELPLQKELGILLQGTGEGLFLMRGDLPSQDLGGLEGRLLELLDSLVELTFFAKAIKRTCDTEGTHGFPLGIKDRNCDVDHFRIYTPVGTHAIHRVTLLTDPFEFPFEPAKILGTRIGLSAQRVAVIGKLLEVSKLHLSGGGSVGRDPEAELGGNPYRAVRLLGEDVYNLLPLKDGEVSGLARIVSEPNEKGLHQGCDCVVAEIRLPELESLNPQAIPLCFRVLDHVPPNLEGREDPKNIVFVEAEPS
jgi:hypothetical protein